MDFASLCCGTPKVNPLTCLLYKLASKQKVLDQIIYLFNNLAYKRYQIITLRCNINHILTNVRKWGRISEQNSAFLSTSSTSPTRNFTEAKRDVTLAVMIQPNVLLRDAPSLLVSFNLFSLKCAKVFSASSSSNCVSKEILRFEAIIVILNLFSIKNVPYLQLQVSKTVSH